MNRKFTIAVCALAALGIISTAGYSWNYATHAYIAGKIGTLMPALKMNQVYGIMAPDIFNLDFSLMDDAILRGFTHGVPAEGPGGLNDDFMAVWWNADGPFQKADALGFLGHNDAWGADYIAHWQGIPPPPAFSYPYENERPGYIIALAVQLDMILDGAGVWTGLESGLGITLTIDERMLFSENVIEFAGDIIIKRADPEIGLKMIDAATVRTPSFWALLMRAFPRQYKPMIKAAEESFQNDMIQFGALLLQDEATIKQTISWQMAAFAIQYLAYQQGVPDPTILYPTLMPLLLPVATGAVEAALGICEGADYMLEVDATAAYVAAQLQARGISSKLLR